MKNIDIFIKDCKTIGLRYKRLNSYTCEDGYECFFVYKVSKTNPRRNKGYTICLAKNKDKLKTTLVFNGTKLKYYVGLLEDEDFLGLDENE